MRRVWKAERSGVRVRSRRKRLEERVETALVVRGLSVEQGRERARDRCECKAIVDGQMVTQEHGVALHLSLRRWESVSGVRWMRRGGGGKPVFAVGPHRGSSR